MKTPIWLNTSIALKMHNAMLTKFGGADGIREPNMLESALARPQQLFNYQSASLYELAASYAYGIIKNHPFVDGNKRTGFIAAYTFLALNNIELIATEEDAYAHTLALASGDASEQEFATWLATVCSPV